MKEHNLIKVKLSSLKFDDTNPNKLNEKQMHGLRESMNKFGYLTPIIVDQNNKIADGEHRALIYKEYNYDEIPAFQVDLKSDVDRRILRQVMNKLHGEHDKQLDANELVQIFKAGQLDELTALIAQEKEDLQRAMLRYHPSLDFVTPENQDEIDKLIDEEFKKKADTQLGDIYQLGNHRLMCADCTDKRSIDRLMLEQKANMVFADPPYNIKFGRLEDGKAGYHVYDDSKKDTDYWQGLITPALQGAFESTQTNAAFYVWSAAANICQMRQVFENIGVHFHQWLYWVKPTLGLMGESDYQYNLEAMTYGYKGKHHFNHRGVAHLVAQQFQQEHDPLTESAHHHARKPIALVKEYLVNSSNEGQIIFDPFLGLGSTLMACEQLSRKCYGIEIDPHYCDVIVKRWEMYTGKKAVKLS